MCSVEEGGVGLQCWSSQWGTAVQGAGGDRIGACRAGGHTAGACRAGAHRVGHTRLGSCRPCVGHGGDLLLVMGLAVMVCISNWSMYHMSWDYHVDTTSLDPDL